MSQWYAKFICLLISLWFSSSTTGTSALSKGKNNHPSVPALILWGLPAVCKWPHRLLRIFFFPQLCTYSHNSSTRLMLFAASFWGISWLSCYILITCEWLFYYLCNSSPWMLRSPACVTDGTSVVWEYELKLSGNVAHLIGPPSTVVSQESQSEACWDLWNRRYYEAVRHVMSS